MNKYLKWFANNSEYTLLLIAVVHFLRFSIIGIISGFIMLIVFFFVRRFSKKIKEKFKIK